MIPGSQNKVYAESCMHLTFFLIHAVLRSVQQAENEEAPAGGRAKIKTLCPSSH